MSFCFLYNVVSENYSVQNSPWGGEGGLLPAQGLKGLKNEFETAMVNEQSVSEPLKLYCTIIITINFVFDYSIC